MRPAVVGPKEPEGRPFGVLGEKTVTPEVLLKAGVVRRAADRIKVLGDGELKSAVTVRAHKFSKSAAEKITKAGGKCEVIAEKREKPEKPAASKKGTGN